VAIALVQSKSTKLTGSGTTIALAFTSNVTAGNLTVVGVSWGAAGGVIEALSSVADGLSNTYTRITNCDVVDSTNDQQHTIIYAKNIAGGACTITVTFTASRSNRGITIAEYSGADTSAPLDQSVSNFQTSPGTGTDAVTSTTKTTTANGELIAGIYTDSTSGAGTTVSAGTGFTKQEDTGGTAGAIQIVYEDQIQSSSGSIAATFTETANHRALSAMATFKAPPAAGGTPERTMMGVGT
jgi:hypothetical protein